MCAGKPDEGGGLWGEGVVVGGWEGGRVDMHFIITRRA